MIAYLKGNLLNIDRGRLIINCGGVGYLVNVPIKNLSSYEIGKEVEVFTYTYVKEEVLALYGFMELDNLRLFESLIGVSGVGPKTGMNIMATGSGSEIVAAIKDGTVDFFTKVPGIGKKNAQRIIVELRNKVGGDVDDTSYLTAENEEVVNALVNLGFAKKEVVNVVKQADKKQSVEDQIRWSLKQLVR